MADELTTQQNADGTDIAADTQVQNQTATTQQQQSEFNLDEAITGRRLTREEALEDIKSRSAYQKSTLSSLERARKLGDAKLIATYEQQLEATIQQTIERKVVIENKVTGKTSVNYIKPVSDGKKFIYSVERAVEGAKSSSGAETYLKYETDRILGGSDAAETAEQRAALLALATKAKQFGGRSVNMKMLTDIVEKAVPEAGRNEAFNLAGSIRPAVDVSKNGQVYTSYGKDLRVEWADSNNRKVARIVSPEGVALTTTTFNPKDLITFGLSKDALIEAYQVGKENGYFKQVSNRGKDVRTIATSTGDTEALKLLEELDTRGQIPFMEALIAGDTSQGYLERQRAQSVLPGGGVMYSEGTSGLKRSRYEKTISGDEAGKMTGFGIDPFLSQEQSDKRLNDLLLYNTIYEAVYDAPQDYRPSWSPDTYLQTLNQSFGTPNNNITFGQGGLQYTFADGGAVNWGSNLGNLDSFSASIGVQNLSLTQGAVFKAANNFNSIDEYDAWRQTQDTRAGYFESLPEKTSTDTQMEQVMAPTVAAPTDRPTSTSTSTGTEGTPTYVGATTTETGTPVATAPTTQQPATTQPTTMPTYGTAPISGTFSTPLQTAGLSAVPSYSAQQTTQPQQQAGFAAQQLAQTMPGTGVDNIGVQTVQYTNQYGQSIPVTETNGQAITYVPPGYTKAAGAAEGGMMHKGYAAGGTATSDDTMLEAKYRIATMNGYNGPKTNASLNAFANASEGMKRKFNSIGTVMANKGGLMRRGFQEGGLNTQPFQTQLAEQTQSLIGQTMQPAQAPVAQIQPSASDFIPTTAGMVTAAAPMAEAATVGTVQQSQMPTMVAPATMQPVTAAPQVQAETAQLQAAQGVVAPEAQVQAAQQQQTSVSGMEAAQGTATMVNAPAAREIQAGEIISGVADAEKAALFNEQIQAATATPSKQATVQGQLEGLMQQFEGGETPAWAAGSMRTAMATLSARGLGASSLAGQAVIQATMEAALPIAQMDAQVQAQFEGQNLSNRQQRAMLAAQQRATFLGMEFDQDFQARVQNSARIGDIANINFTAEQNIALENSRAANTMNLNNLSNRQAMVMAEAAALSQLDTQNLNNRQQAAVQNAQNFMQMDMTNLANEQQTAMFASQQNIQALFTDQAAENASAQFNAANENQTNQFFANLTSQTSQFNASQQNAMDQFNVNSVNALREFNSEIQQQRDLFNAQNGLVIAQSNAQWRQNIATLNTAAQNESNADFAKTINNMTTRNLDVYWQRERDLMDYAWRTMDNAQARSNALTIAEMQVQAEVDKTAGAATGGLVNKAFDFFLSQL